MPKSKYSELDYSYQALFTEEEWNQMIGRIELVKAAHDDPANVLDQTLKYAYLINVNNRRESYGAVYRVHASYEQLRTKLPGLLRLACSSPFIGPFIFMTARPTAGSQDLERTVRAMTYYKHRVDFDIWDLPWLKPIEPSAPVNQNQTPFGPTQRRLWA